MRLERAHVGGPADRFVEGAELATDAESTSDLQRLKRIGEIDRAPL
jgi:hypothetical protein